MLWQDTQFNTLKSFFSEVYSKCNEPTPYEQIILEKNTMEQSDNFINSQIIYLNKLKQEKKLAKLIKKLKFLGLK